VILQWVKLLNAESDCIFWNIFNFQLIISFNEDLLNKHPVSYHTTCPKTQYEQLMTLDSRGNQRFTVGPKHRVLRYASGELIGVRLITQLSQNLMNL
jgi:hypothetical protein